MRKPGTREGSAALFLRPCSEPARGVKRPATSALPGAPFKGERDDDGRGAAATRGCEVTGTPNFLITSVLRSFSFSRRKLLQRRFCVRPHTHTRDIMGGQSSLLCRVYRRAGSRLLHFPKFSSAGAPSIA